MKKRLFTLLFALVAMVTTANAQVVLNAANFPDYNFRMYVTWNYSEWVESEEDEHDGYYILDPSKVAGATEMNLFLYEFKIKSLKGIEYFTVLKKLDCNGHQLTSLNVSGCTALEYLSCYNNQLTSLNVSGCTALTELRCYKNQLTSLNASGCTALKNLSCYNNQLTSLNVSGCTTLKYLSCDNNQLTSLNVSGCTALVDFWCYDNQLTSINVSGCTALKNLNCYNNQLTSLNASGCTALEYLSCYNNQLTSLNVSGCTALTELRCYKNQLTSLNVTENTTLETLECNSNKLTSLNVAKNTTLKKLSCGANQLTSLDVSKNTALTELNCGDNQLTSLDVSKNTALEYLGCGHNSLASLDVSKNTALTELYCNTNPLFSLDVSKNTVLTKLYCYVNKLTFLDVSKNTALIYLSCEGNQLTALDVSKNIALTGLDCDVNQLTSLNVSKNATALNHIRCCVNQLKNKAMQNLVDSLPTVTDGAFYVIHTKVNNEGNVCTKAQVAIAKEKGWKVYNGGGWQEYEGIDDVLLLDDDNFPDESFRNAIAKELGLAEGSEINEGLIVATTKLDVSDGKITELSGIEYFTALTTLYCQVNQISNKAMTSLIAALPDLSGNEAKGLMLTEETNPRRGALYAVDFTDENEQNVCTAEHVAAANAKGWTVYCKRASGWEEYNGAKSGILLNEVFFPDANFRSELSDLFGIGEGDEVTENMIATGMLMIQKSSIADLAGIEYFTNLRTLLCGENPLTLLDVSKNTKLQRLNCKGYGQGLLASLNVSGCAILETLECDDNQLTSIDASNNPELYMLSCNNNQLSSLDLSKNTKLESLKCSNNSLTSLVVSDNASRMKILECDLNNINGETMQNLVESLPTVTNGELYVIDTSNPNENNEITKQQVSIAKEKGWTVYDKNGGSKVEYAGIDIDTPTDINSVDSGVLTNDSWYTIDGKKLAGEPKEKGIYIRNGRKVVK